MLLTIAVDANPILSALLGGYARTILFDPRFCFLTTAFTMTEVGRYLPRIAKKSAVPISYLEKALALLPIEVVGRDHYSSVLSEARRLIAEIDPDDVDILALAVQEKITLWTNDRDFLKAVLPVRIIRTSDFIL